MGNLGTQANGTGISLITWLGGNIGYVSRWYDASGYNNHAFQINSAFQPRIDIANKMVDFGVKVTGSSFSFPFLVLSVSSSATAPISIGNSAYTFVVKHGTINNGFGSLFGIGSKTENYGVSAGLCSYGSCGYYSFWGYYYWAYSNNFGVYGPGNIISETYSPSSTFRIM